MAARRQGLSIRIRFIPAVLLLCLALAACGSSGTSSAPGSSAGSSAAGEATATPDGGGQTADGLCGVMTEEMAVAALGGPAGAPQGGDVVPRPNGIYCHYALASDDNLTVEAQLKEMSREEFDAMATTLLMDEPLEGAGEAAFQRATGIMGLPGTSILVFRDGRGVNVTITGEGDAADQLAAAIVIAEATLAS